MSYLDYEVARTRIADMHREAARQRLAAGMESPRRRRRRWPRLTARAWRWFVRRGQLHPSPRKA